MSELLRNITPVTQGVREVYGLVPPDLLRERMFADQSADYVHAEEELERLREERKKPLAGRLARNMLYGAAIGAGAGLGKGLIWNAGDIKSSLPMAGLLAGTAALTSGGFTVARDALRSFLRRRAKKTISESPTPVRKVVTNPKTREDVEEYARADWYPWYGLEAGALYGGLGTLAGGLLFGKGQSTGAKLTQLGIGTAAGSAVGLLAGWLYKRRQRRNMQERIRNAYRISQEQAEEGELRKTAKVLERTRFALRIVAS